MPHPYLKEIQKIFVANGNQLIAKGAKAYLLNQFEFYGIKTPLRRQLCKAFYKTHPIKDHTELSKLIKECFNEPQRELHYFAIELLGHHKKIWSIKTIPLIEWMITHQSWWDSVDSTNTHVISKFFLLHPEHIEACTSKWNQSSNKWLIRMSILFQLTYKTKTNTNLLSRYIENSQLHEDFFVRKAIGWALRAYAYTNKKWVVQFVKAHP
ncbi:MAG: DNA alkylation repair protein, partial [Chitinophagaceae bacterium]